MPRRVFSFEPGVDSFPQWVDPGSGIFVPAWLLAMEARQEVQLAVNGAMSLLSSPYGAAFTFEDTDAIDAGNSSGYYHSDEQVANYGGETLFTATFTADSGAGSSTTFRFVIPASTLAGSNVYSQVRLLFRATAAGTLTYNPGYIQEKAGSGDAYDFSATPVQITVGSSGTITIPAGTEVWSDWLDLAIDAAKNYVVSLYKTGGTSRQETTSGITQYSKAGSDASTVNASGYSGPASVGWIGGVEGRTNPGNMTLCTTAVSAGSVPGSGRIVAQMDFPDNDVTINTDVVFGLSRNGGTTFEDATMNVLQTIGTVRILQSDEIDLTGQSSDSSMVIRVTTPGSKKTEIMDLHGLWV